LTTQGDKAAVLASIGQNYRRPAAGRSTQLLGL
jgi:hypothetical protein